MTASLKYAASAAALGLALTLGLGATAVGQSFSGDPAYGGLSLRDGSVGASVRAGGAWSADLLSQGCYGYITEAPTLTVEYAGGEDLYLSAGADEDTIMVVRTPNGDLHCDDDGAGDLNPGLVFAKAERGVYELWLGTYSAGVGTPAAQIHASTSGF